MTDVADPRRRQLLLYTLLALSAALFLVERTLPAFHAFSWFQPDSYSYLEANAARPPGYPLLMRAFGVSASSPNALDLVQHIALLAAGMGLAYRFASTYGQPVLAVMLALSVVGNPLVVSYCYTALPEALFLTLLMVHLSLVLALSSGWRRGTVAGISASAAALVLLKPTGYAVIAGLAVIAVAWRREWRTLHWLIIPAGLVLLAVSAGNYLARGIFATQAQGGYSRLTFVGQFLSETTPTPYPEAQRHIVAATTPIRLALAQLPSLEIYHLLGSTEYHDVESIVHDALIAESTRQLGRPIADPRIFPLDPAVADVFDRVGGSLANAAVRERPREYVYQVGASLYGLWWQPLIRSRGALPALQAAIDAQLAQHPSLNRSPVAFRAFPWPVFAVIRGALLLIFLCSLAGFLLLWSPDPTRRIAGYAAILLHGYFLLVSLTQPGLPRYAIAVWPVSMLLLFACVALGAKARFGSRR